MARLVLGSLLSELGYGHDDTTNTYQPPLKTDPLLTLKTDLSAAWFLVMFSSGFGLVSVYPGTDRYGRCPIFEDYLRWRSRLQVGADRRLEL
jgi:hypothetical protein